MNARTELDAAHAALGEARSKHDVAAAALGRGKQAAAAAQGELAQRETEERDWIARHARRLEDRALAGTAGPSPSLVPTDKAFLAKRTAEVTRDAAMQAVRSLEAVEHASQQEFVAAEKAVKGAARTALHAQIRTDFEELERLTAQRRQLRESLLGAYFAAGKALADREWLRVDADAETHSSAAMLIGLPLIGVSLHDPAAFGGDPRPARARIDAAAAAWGARLKALESGDVAFPLAEAAA